MEEIPITHLTNRLEGSGKDSLGKFHSFPFVLPGDIVRVERFKRKRRKPTLKVQSIEKRPRTKDPHCPHFTECGGCLAQHIPYEEQFRLLTEPIRKDFQTKFGYDLDFLPASEIYHYRKRMDFSIFPGGRWGLRERGNFRKIVPIQNCSIQSQEANGEWERVRSVLSEFPSLAWDRRDSRGGLKYVTLRTPAQGKGGIVIFTFTQGWEKEGELARFEERLLQVLEFPNIVFCFNRFASEVSAFGDLRIVRGRSGFEEEIFGKKIFVPFDSFFQPNPKGFLPIVSFIQKHLPKTKLEFCDFFCGNGFFSQVLGTGFSKIICLDLNPASIASAKASLKELYPNAELEAQVVDLHKKGQILPPQEFQVLVVDPPRAGLGNSVCEWLESYGAQHLFYVSCNPESQIADLPRFQSRYDFVQGLVTDPYPHTPHLESVLYFRKK